MKAMHVYKNMTYLGIGLLITDNILYIQNRLIQLNPYHLLANYIDCEEWNDFIDSQELIQVGSLCLPS